jgi:hypothetical protein
MEDLKMKVPEGYIIDKEVSTVDRVVLKKTDAFPYDKVSGCFVDNMSQVRCIEGESREEHNKNVFATKNQASGAIFYHPLIITSTRKILHPIRLPITISVFNLLC